MLIFIFFGFICFCFLSDGIIFYLFGCARKFKNDRRCKVWTCPNKDRCNFYIENNVEK